MPPAPGRTAAGPRGDDRRAPRTGSRSSASATPGSIGCLRQAPWTRELAVAGPLPRQRLLGAGDRRENVITLGNSGTGKTHVALGLGLAACQKGLSVGFTTAAALVHELIEARDEKQLLRFQKRLASYKLPIIDELGFVPLSKTGAELLFEVFSQRYERGSILVTSNLPFDEWTEVFGSERLTGALLDRLTHHVHILEMNGESYRLNQSRQRRDPAAE